MEEALITIPIGTLVWLIVCTVSCIFMLMLQCGFMLHDISEERKKKKKDGTENQSK